MRESFLHSGMALIILALFTPHAGALILEDFEDSSLDPALIFNGTGSAAISSINGRAVMTGGVGEAAVIRTKDFVHGPYVFKTRFYTDSGSWDDVGVAAEEPIPSEAYTYHAYKVGVQIYRNSALDKVLAQIKYHASNDISYKWDIHSSRWIESDTNETATTYYTESPWLDVEIRKYDDNSYAISIFDPSTNDMINTSRIYDVMNAGNPDIVFTGRIYYASRHAGGTRMLDYFIINDSLPSSFYSDFNDPEIPAVLYLANGSFSIQNGNLFGEENGSIVVMFVNTSPSSSLITEAKLAYAGTKNPEKNNNIALTLRCTEARYKFGWYDSNLIMIFELDNGSKNLLYRLPLTFKQNEYHVFRMVYNSTDLAFILDSMNLFSHSRALHDCIAGIEAGYGDSILVDYMNVTHTSRFNITSIDNDMDDDGLADLTELLHQLDPTRQDTDDDAINDSLELELLSSYAPIFVYASSSPAHEFFAQPVELFVNKSFLYKLPGKKLRENISVYGLAEYNDSHYLDFQEIRDYHHSYNLLLPSYGYFVYGRAGISEHYGNKYVVLQYWHHYLYNDFINEHEGDWEMVEILINASDFKPKYVIYAQHEDSTYHNGGEIKHWGDVVKNNTHPYVYVARGSHASYFTPGKHFLLRNVPIFYDVCADDGLTLTPENYTLTILRDKYLQPWLEFSGRWGKVWLSQNTDMLGSNGPAGPAHHEEKWRTPASWGLKYLTRVPPAYFIVAYFEDSMAVVKDNLGRMVGFVNNTIVKQIPDTDVVSVINQSLFILPHPTGESTFLLASTTNQSLAQPAQYSFEIQSNESYDFHIFMVEENKSLHLHFTNITTNSSTNETLILRRDAVIFNSSAENASITVGLIENNTAVNYEAIELTNKSYILNLSEIYSALSSPECEINVSITQLSCTTCPRGEKLNYKITVTTDYENKDKEINVSYYATNIYGRVLFNRSTTFKDFVARKTKSRQLTLNFDNEVMFLHANVSSASCRIKPSSELYDNATIFVLKQDQSSENKDEEAFVKIMEVDKLSARFGDVVKVHINTSRGSETSYALYVFVENAENGYDASEKYAIYLKEKHKVYELSIPIQLKPNCRHNLKPGKYVVVAQLGTKSVAVDKKVIWLEGENPKLCRKVVYYSSSSKEKTKSTLEGMNASRKEVGVEIHPSINCDDSGNMSLNVVLFNPNNFTINARIYYLLDGIDDNTINMINVILKPGANTSQSIPVLRSIDLKETKYIKIVFESDGLRKVEKVDLTPCGVGFGNTALTSYKNKHTEKSSGITGRMAAHTTGVLTKIKNLVVSFIYAVFS